MPSLQTYQQAQTWLAGRTSVPTVLGSRALALSPDFPAAAKAHSFFSAKVSEGHILEALRAEVTDLATGTTDIASARARLKTFLSRQGLPIADIGWTDTPPVGVTPEDWAQAKQISNLGSTRRLDLILRQNAAMAHAIGRRQVSLDPDIAERWPNFRYIITDDGRERPEHRALDGLSLPKTDPFWHTHTPPWDYNCRCDIEDSDAPANGTATPDGRILNPATGQIVDTTLAPESGYTFDIDSALSTDPSSYDWTTITDTALGKAYKQAAPKSKPEPKLPAFTPAKTRDEAEAWARDNLVSEKAKAAYADRLAYAERYEREHPGVTFKRPTPPVSYRGLDTWSANTINQTLADEIRAGGMKPLREVRARTFGGRNKGVLARMSNQGNLELNSSALGSKKKVHKHLDNASRIFGGEGDRIIADLTAKSGTMSATEKRKLDHFRDVLRYSCENVGYEPGSTAERALRSTLHHEVGHQAWDTMYAGQPEQRKDWLNRALSACGKAQKDESRYNLSAYASASQFAPQEYFAEARSAFMLGEPTRIHPDVLTILKEIAL